MTIIAFNSSEIKESDYNFIISNIILSRKGTFTYNQIVTQLSAMFANVNTNMIKVLKNSLIRLRDDGFLDILGSNYKVIINNSL